jgi:hypothetical protein
MALVLTRQDAPRSKRDATLPLQFRLIFAVCFAVFLTAALLERLLPWTWRRGKAAPITRAWQSARTCTTYAFMG